jgi:hypothetical protein
MTPGRSIRLKPAPLAGWAFDLGRPQKPTAATTASRARWGARVARFRSPSARWRRQPSAATWTRSALQAPQGEPVQVRQPVRRPAQPDRGRSEPRRGPPSASAAPVWARIHPRPLLPPPAGPSLPRRASASASAARAGVRSCLAAWTPRVPDRVPRSPAPRAGSPSPLCGKARRRAVAPARFAGRRPASQAGARAHQRRMTQPPPGSLVTATAWSPAPGRPAPWYRVWSPGRAVGVGSLLADPLGGQSIAAAPWPLRLSSVRRRRWSAHPRRLGLAAAPPSRPLRRPPGHIPTGPDRRPRL